MLAIVADGCCMPQGLDTAARQHVVQHAAETAARLLHAMRRQAAEQDTAAVLQKTADSLQEMCSGLVTTVKDVRCKVEVAVSLKSLVISFPT